MPALRYFMAHPTLQYGPNPTLARRQYSATFSSNMTKAQRVLSQFALVGVTERHAAFAAKLCALTKPARPPSAAGGGSQVTGCTPGTALHARRDSFRPALTDFPPEFVSELRKDFIHPAEQAIYEIANAMAPSEHSAGSPALPPATEEGLVLPSDTVQEGDGLTFPKKGDYLTMHYTGMLAEGGKVFDSSRDRGKPYRFRIGVGQVIQGWDEGVMRMSLGQRAMLRIPSGKGYGTVGAGGVIPPGADLVFDVELLAID